MFSAAHRVRSSVQDTALCNMPFAFQWLAQTYVAPAALDGSQIWSSGGLCQLEGDVLKSSTQTLLLYF